jgi:hypothetical protein
MTPSPRGEEVTSRSFAQVTLVSGHWFSTILSPHMCGIIPTGTHDMKLPHFSLRKKVGTLNRHDEEVFAQAKQLALLRLEQSIADRRHMPPKGTFRRAIGRQQQKRAHDLGFHNRASCAPLMLFVRSTLLPVDVIRRRVHSLTAKLALPSVLFPVLLSSSPHWPGL